MFNLLQICGKKAGVQMLLPRDVVNRQVHMSKLL